VISNLRPRIKRYGKKEKDRCVDKLQTGIIIAMYKDKERGDSR